MRLPPTPRSLLSEKPLQTLRQLFLGPSQPETRAESPLGLEDDAESVEKGGGGGFPCPPPSQALNKSRELMGAAQSP